MHNWRDTEVTGKLPIFHAIRIVSAAIGWHLLALTAATAGERPLKGGEVKPDVIYHNYCSVCHGDRGDGRSRARNSLVPPPRDFTTAPNLTREYMVAIVANGKPGTAMTAWKTQLNEREIAAVVDYITTAFVEGKGASIGTPAQGAAAISGVTAHGGRERDAPPVGRATAAGQVSMADMSLPLPNDLRGDPAKGGRFYAGNCSTCHGMKGDGKGPRAYFIRPKPRNFVDTAARNTYNRPALYAAISMGKLGTEMPAWSKVLGEQEMADVAEYVFQQFIQGKRVANR